MSETNDPIKLIVVGAGPGGYAAAFYAADFGMDVTLIDPKDNPGGVCLHYGCIPSKALLHVAKVINDVKEVKNVGVDFGEPKIDIDKIREFKEGVVGKLTGGLGDLVKRRKIRHIQGMAKFVDSDTLLVTKNDGTEEKLTIEKCIIATGSAPVTIPTFPNESPKLLNSRGGLDLQDIPESMLIVGGGYIGLEMATVYAALGSKVTIVEILPNLLPGADKDLVMTLTKSIKNKFEKIMLRTKVTAMEDTQTGMKVTFVNHKEEETQELFSRVLVSVGRKPLTNGLGLENTNIELDRKNYVVVNPQRRTAEQNVYAIGDITGNPMLAHKATAEGKVAVEAIAGEKVAFEPRAIPAVVFTDPEIAWCGLTDTEAKEKGIKCKIAKFPWGASGKATSMDRNDGLTKLLFDPETERILGMAIVGSGVGEMIAEGILAIEMGATAKDLLMSIHPHPTLSETVMEAAEVFFGRSTHVYQPKRKPRE